MESIPVGDMFVVFEGLRVLPGGVNNHTFISYQVDPVTGALVWTFISTIGFLKPFQGNDIRMKIISTIHLGDLVRITGAYQNFIILSSDYTNYQGIYFQLQFCIVPPRQADFDLVNTDRLNF